MRKILSALAAGAMVCALLLSCTKDFEKINTDPNKLAYGAASPSSLLEPLLYGIAVNNQYQAWFFANELVQVTAYTAGQTTQIHQYQITDGQWQSQWDNFARYGFDAEHMMRQAIARSDKYFEALGLILKVYELSTLSALYGDIPYAEAYQQSANTSPAFDSQTRLAEEFIADLDSAATILGRHPAVSKTAVDKLYQGNHQKWIKFANSLKLRILCRMSGIDDSYWAAIQQIVDDPIAHPIFAANEDNAVIAFSDSDPYRSYWGQNSTTEATFTGHRITSTMINMMVQFSGNNALFEDPRLEIYAKKRGNVWQGSYGGVNTDEFKQYDDGAAVPNFSILTSSATPAFFMEYSEVLFILAEGVEKGKITVAGQTAKSLYESAVRASIGKWAAIANASPRQLIVRQSQINELLANPLAAWGTTKYSSNLELIGCQKFLALYFCGYEVFNEWRRTEYPVFDIADGAVSNGYELPTRYGYPNYTVASNRVHVREALTRMGGEGAVNNMHIRLDWSYAALNGAHRRPHPLQQ